MSLSEAERGTPRTVYRSASMRTSAVQMRCCCGEAAARVHALTLLARAGVLGATQAALAATGLLPKRLRRCACGCACSGEPLTAAARTKTAKPRIVDDIRYAWLPKDLWKARRGGGVISGRSPYGLLFFLCNKKKTKRGRFLDVGLGPAKMLPPEVPAQLAEALLSSAHPGRNLPLSWTATLLLFALSIVFETCGTACMKMSNRSHWWQLGTVGFYVLSFGVFPLVLRRIPLSLAYAVWSGVGTRPALLLSLFPIVNQMNHHFAHVSHTALTHSISPHPASSFSWASYSSERL